MVIMSPVGCKGMLHIIPMHRKRSLSQLFQIAPTTCMQWGTHAFFLQVLQQLIEQGSHPSLTPTVCETLLQDVPSTGVKPVQEEGGGEEEGGKKGGGEREDKAVCDPSTGLVVLMGYPDYPLYKRLADSLAYWMVTG